MNYARNGGGVAYPRSLSLGQILTVPISIQRDFDFERAQRAYRLMHRWEAVLSHLRSRCKRAIRKVSRGLSARVDADLATLLELAQLQEKLSLLESLTPKSVGSDVRILLSSWMLQESFEYCTQDEREGLHFILGVESDGVRIGTQIRTFPYAERSIVSATGDLAAISRIGIEMHEAGHCLVAMIHSHPGGGAGSNRPSGTDMHTQRLMEATSRCVGGIWARDGHLRFYSDKLTFDVEIVGSHVERSNDGNWKLGSASTALALRDA